MTCQLRRNDSKTVVGEYEGLVKIIMRTVITCRILSWQMGKDLRFPIRNTRWISLRVIFVNACSAHPKAIVTNR